MGKSTGTLRLRRRSEPKPIGENVAVLAARMWREGYCARDIERSIGVPVERMGEAVAQGLRAMLCNPLLDVERVDHQDPPRAVMS